MDNLKKHLDFSRFSLNVAKYEAGRHYDDMEMDIEIRAETLIGLIHEKRDELLESVKGLRKQADDEFDSIVDTHARQYSWLEDKFNTYVNHLETENNEPNRYICAIFCILIFFIKD